ncbi:amidase [Streptomyces sp. HSW2009]|uniref:amidase n=1 Tax=Streptomyces sp. HSW2009 TaxID=3142890 RepID=UPI0032EDA23B
MQVSEYVRFDAVGLAELVAAGEVTADELQEVAHRALEAVNPQLNAVVESWEADAAPPPGSTPLAGVPFLVKDIGVLLAGRRSELGSRLAAGHVADADSALARRLRRAGLVVFGRTATPELAYSTTTEPVLYGATRNPWDLTRRAGGSSGGAGAAVAAGVGPIAHGTDAAGSIRIPAAYNGLFGLKPTRGRISVGPQFDEVFNGLAVQGCVSRTVRDSAALLDLVSGPEPGDPYVAPEPVRPYAREVGRPPGALRIGVVAQPWGGHRTSPPVAAALARTVHLLESRGPPGGGGAGGPGGGPPGGGGAPGPRWGPAARAPGARPGRATEAHRGDRDRRDVPRRTVGPRRPRGRGARRRGRVGCGGRAERRAADEPRGMRQQGRVVRAGQASA